jgi:hypothetical protein
MSRKPLLVIVTTSVLTALLIITSMLLLRVDGTQTQTSLETGALVIFSPEGVVYNASTDRISLVMSTDRKSNITDIGGLVEEQFLAWAQSPSLSYSLRVEFRAPEQLYSVFGHVQIVLVGEYMETLYNNSLDYPEGFAVMGFSVHGNHSFMSSNITQHAFQVQWAAELSSSSSAEFAFECAVMLTLVHPDMVIVPTPPVLRQAVSLIPSVCIVALAIVIVGQQGGTTKWVNSAK